MAKPVFWLVGVGLLVLTIGWNRPITPSQVLDAHLSTIRQESGDGMSQWYSRFLVAQETWPFGPRPDRFARILEANAGSQPANLIARGRIRILIQQDLCDSARQEAKRALERGLLDSAEYHYWTGVAFLRVAELNNCLVRHTDESCIFPFQGTGIAPNSSNFRQALSAFTQVPRQSSWGHRAFWLSQIASSALGNATVSPWRVAGKDVPEVYSVKFRNVAFQQGIRAPGVSGAALAEDLDGDNQPELVCSSVLPEFPLLMYRKAGNTWQNVTQARGLGGVKGGMQLLAADIENDGDVDLLLLRGAWQEKYGHQPPALLVNDGKGGFMERTHLSGLATAVPHNAGAFADLNRDGQVDLVLGTEGYTSHPALYSPVYLNTGYGQFEECSMRMGIQVQAYVKGLSVADWDGNGWPDIFFSCYGAPNQLWLNQGVQPNGLPRFRKVPLPVADLIYSFGTVASDFDQDGRVDLFIAGYRNNSGATESYIHVPDLYAERETQAPTFPCRLLLNRSSNGDIAFQDVTSDWGLNQPSFLTMGLSVGDVNNDGYPDIYLGTGGPETDALVPNQLLVNRKGQRFELAGEAAGVGILQKGHGVAFADLDGDGDQDIWHDVGGFYANDAFFNALLMNETPSTNRWLQLKLQGMEANRSAIGARVEVELEGVQGIYRHYFAVGENGSFGGNSLLVEMGLGDANAIRRITVQWPDTRASHSVYPGSNFQFGRRYLIVQGNPRPLVY